MNIFNKIWPWRKRREAIAEEKRKMLRERLARVLNEPPMMHGSSRPERVKPSYRGTIQATRG
jgi:hypothetical protein